MMSQSVITTHYLQEDSSGWVMFRPSLSDPLRPAATLVTRHRPLSSEGERFQSPGEFTPIGEAYVNILQRRIIHMTT